MKVEWKDHGKTTGKTWENHGKTTGKPWENHGKLVIYMENHYFSQIIRKILLVFFGSFEWEHQQFLLQSMVDFPAITPTAVVYGYLRFALKWC